MTKIFNKNWIAIIALLFLMSATSFVLAETETDSSALVGPETNAQEGVENDTTNYNGDKTDLPVDTLINEYKFVGVSQTIVDCSKIGYAPLKFSSGADVCWGKEVYNSSIENYKKTLGLNAKINNQRFINSAGELITCKYGTQVVKNSSDILVCEEKKEASPSEKKQVASDTVNYEAKAKLLKGNDVEALLAEIKELRNQVREQQAQINHMKKLMAGQQNVKPETESTLNNFITYGVDENTKSLGEGERAAVLYSYKEAYNKLPESDAELEDVVRISNGRWPADRNLEAEKRARHLFRKIYNRIANLNNPKDNAAITVMAYGLRQKAENRKLETEERALKIYKDIYGKLPETTEEWNALQAIAYSGATRQTDTDGDLVSDEYETELGTDPTKADTDDDGYQDGIEVDNDYNPLADD